MSRINDKVHFARSDIEAMLRALAFPNSGARTSVHWDYDREGWLDGASVIEYKNPSPTEE